MSTLHRAQILLESEQHEALVQIADQEGRSISDVVREIVRHHIAERERLAEDIAALRAIEQLTRIRAMVQEEHGIYQGDLLAEVRVEWEEEAERIGRGEA